MLKMVICNRRKVAKGEVDFCIEQMLFISVLCHSRNRSYPCTSGLVLHTVVVAHVWYGTGDLRESLSVWSTDPLSGT